uniref:hypothetical protein n=1 Tax=Yoonia sp. TaxID=2212373 RepID=UPI0040482489
MQQLQSRQWYQAATNPALIALTFLCNRFARATSYIHEPVFPGYSRSNGYDQIILATRPITAQLAVYVGCNSFKLVGDDDIAFRVVLDDAGAMRDPPQHQQPAKECRGDGEMFDATTGKRITDASVTATIQEEGLGGADYSLDPFLVGDALTFGGYVEFQKASLYEISLRVVLPEDGRVIAETFEYRH